MMAGLESHDRDLHQQARVDKVKIVHAGEDIENTIRPLADTLEKHLKLGEQVEYVRAFRPGTDIAEYIMRCICEESSDTKLVIVISETFISNCSTNQEAFAKIKSTLFLQNHSQSKFALVSPSDVPRQWANLRCVNLGSCINEIEGGNLAEAVYKQWFGSQATLSSQAELSMQNLFLTSDFVEEAYVPDMVKIIHAMTQQEARQKYWGKLATAIEDVANPENTTPSRLHFRGDSSVAQTLLTDLEGFKKCAATKKVNAVIMWCPDMLRFLNQDTAAKTRFIDILCEDSKQQKLYAHFMFGVDSRQMNCFSQRMWQFLSLHHHMALIEDSQKDEPNLDYRPFASIFLRIWAGTRREARSPEESCDPTMDSIEASIEHIHEVSRTTSSSSQYQSSLNQFHPQQDQNRDHLVMNGVSIDHIDANLIQEKGKALGNTDSFRQGRLVTTSDSWDPNLAAAADKSRESKSDGCSNPPGNWSLCGVSLQDGRAIVQGQPGAVCQPNVDSSGHNRMATGSIGSISVDSVRGSKLPDARCRSVPCGPAGTPSETPGQQSPASGGAVSRPPGGTHGPIAGDRQMAQAYHPVSNKSGANAGQNRIAASGFISHSICSTRSQGPTSQGLISGGTTADGGIVSGSMCQSSGSGSNHLSLQQNPVRLSSDADQQLDAEMQRVSDSFGEPRSLPFVGTRSEQDQDTSVSMMHSSRSMPSMSVAPSTLNSSFPSAAEGVNPVQSGESDSSTQLESDIQTPGSLLLSKLGEATIRKLKILLDPMKNAIADWRDLASYFKVSSEMINYWKGMHSTNCSPIEQLIDWLKTNKKNMTIDDVKEGLKEIERYDVLKYLSEAGF